MKGPLSLRPVDVQDNFGFRAALYAVNALYKRCGVSPVTNSYARESVSSLIKQSKAQHFSILLQEWYSTNVDQEKVQELIDNLPGQILEEDVSRYQEETAVNDIEWSALATVFRCSIAVKVLMSRKNCDNRIDETRRQTPGWKIAVPSPNLFGLSLERSPRPATACVFVVCQQWGRFKKFFPLIPSEQPIFKPGLPLSISNSSAGINENIEKNSQSCCKEEYMTTHSSSKTTVVEQTGPKSFENSSSSTESQMEMKQVKFSDRNETFGYATPVTAPSTPKQKPMSSFMEDELPSEPMQMALGSILSGDSNQDNQRTSEDKLGLVSDSEREKKPVSETKKAREISELSDASVLFHRIYGSNSKTERESSSLEIYGRVYDTYRQ